MRKLLMTLVPAIAIATLPALAQSSESQSTTTTTTGVTPAPDMSQTTTKKVERSDTASPMGESHASHSYEKKTTSDGYDSSTRTRSSDHAVTNGVDGSTSESKTTTTQTGPQ